MRTKSRLNILRMLLVASAVLFFFSACQFNSNYQKVGETSLQGTWVQESVPHQNELLNYSLNEFRFSCDSVYVTVRNFAKEPVIIDACYNGGEWTEYARGLYIIRNDSLLIEATYVHANGKQKLTGCYHIGQYLSRLSIEKQTVDSLFLQDRNSYLPIQLRKTESTTCVPQIVY